MYNYATAVDILKSSSVLIFITSIIQAAMYNLKVQLSVCVYANDSLDNTKKTMLRIKQNMAKSIYHPIGVKLSVKKRNERMSLECISSTDESRYKCRMLVQCLNMCRPTVLSIKTPPCLSFLTKSLKSVTE
jgi:hypothetical protein